MMISFVKRNWVLVGIVVCDDLGCVRDCIDKKIWVQLGCVYMMVWILIQQFQQFQEVWVSLEPLV